MTRTVRARRSAGRLLLSLLLVAALGTAAASAAPAAGPGDGPGGPVLVVANPSDPFSRYYAEILRAEGLNEFDVVDLGSLTAQALAAYQVVVLAPNGADRRAGVAADRLGAGRRQPRRHAARREAGRRCSASPRRAATVDNGYLKVDTARRPGAGITTDTMQFHGTADRYTLSGATAVATLYTSATAATSNPAVTLRTSARTGAGRGVHVRPRPLGRLHAPGQPRVGRAEARRRSTPIRSDDLFFGAARADWVDLSKVAIPQADEQQRLLANLVTEMSADRLPLPRFWYFPRGEKAVVDHDR